MTSPEVYRARSIKRLRRTKSEMTAFRNAIFEIAQIHQPISVRGVYYRAEVQGLVPKTNQGYRRVQETLVWLRENRIMPFSWIVDGTRYTLRRPSYTSAEQAVRAAAAAYSQSLWANASVAVEVWVEKDAMVGVLEPITTHFDVGLYVARGCSSITFTHKSALELAERSVPSRILHLGDYDVMGRRAAKAIERDLKKYAPEADIEFRSIALTEDQIVGWGLPTREEKIKRQTAIAAELEAAPPARLRNLLRQHIEQYIDKRTLNVMRVAEESERKYLFRIADIMGQRS